MRGVLDKLKSRAFISTVSLLILVLMVGVGILLSNTYGASQVAGNAQQLHWTNATKGAAGIARASVAQAVFFSFDDVSGTDASADAVTEARANVSLVASAGGTELSDESLDAAITNYVAAAEETLRLAEAGEPSLAEAHRINIFETEYQELDGLLEVRQTRLAAAISDSENSAGQISRITFVAIAFLIPAVAMLVFWLVLRRRMRIREAEMEARIQAERDLNRAKDDLIAGLSHELRTPLTTIFGFSELLLEDESVNGEARELLGMINASSSDLTRMVNDLLTAARLDAGALTTSMGEVDLAQEVKAVAEPYLRSGERLTVEVPTIAVYSDALHVRQIVHNLVSNALRHGGDEIVLSAHEKDNRVYLVVADSGDGVPEEMEPSLFKRFANAGRDALVAGSVGLGLAISQELARKLGGSLQYQRIDGFTAFTVTLPAMRKRVEPGTEPVKRLPTPVAS